MKQEYIFYTPIQTTINDSCTLPDDEASHFIKSLRGRSGDLVKITDGRGRLFSATAWVEKSEVTLRDLTLIKETALENLPRLAIALLKQPDRMEWLVEKAVEIGVSEITWLLTEKSHRYGYRHERMARIAIAAMKQSGRLWLPIINDPVEFSVGIKSSEDSMKFIAHCQDANDKVSLIKMIAPNVPALILIGPESDFSEQEVHTAIEQRFIPVSLGHSRLRSETAAIYALTIFSGVIAT